MSCDTQRPNQTEERPMLSLEESASIEISARKWKKTGLNNVTVFDFEITDNKRIIAATSDGLYYSTDEGETWEHIYNEFLTGQQINCIKQTDSALYAGVAASGIYRSVDNGYTWQQSNVGITPNNNIIVKTIFSKEGILFAGTRNGLFVSFNAGDLWRPASHEFPLVKKSGDSLSRYSTVSNIMSDGKDIIVLTEGGVAVSNNEGNSWNFPKHTGLSNKDMISTVAMKGQVLYAGRYLKEGIYVSADKGETWEKSGLEGQNIYKVFVSPNGIMYSGTSNEGIFRSVNGGKDWTDFNVGIPKETSVFTFTVTPGGTVLAGTEGKGIYRLIK